jgi:hypothetical protein
MRRASITSSNRTGCFLPGTQRKCGAASGAQASDAHEARIARFSLSVEIRIVDDVGWMLECLGGMQQLVCIPAVPDIVKRVLAKTIHQRAHELPPFLKEVALGEMGAQATSVRAPDTLSGLVRRSKTDPWRATM